MNVVVGVFAFRQTLDSDPSFKQEQGSAAARFLLAPSAAAATPGLLDGYGYDQFVQLRQHQRRAVRPGRRGRSPIGCALLPGLRFNYDQKDVDFDQQVYGGLQTTNPALIALQRSVLAPQAYTADVDDTNLSGQLTAAYKVAERVNAYATYATGFKSVGLNLNGVPTDAHGPAGALGGDGEARGRAPRRGRRQDRAVPRRDRERHASTTPTIKDFQAQVVNAGVGVLRGYLANAEKVRVRGVEFDGSARVGRSV